MILHIFNPEHDIALAANLSNFTAPHAGRKLRADLGFLPALWAGDEDAVLVDSIEQARKSYSRLRARVGGCEPRFVDKSQLSQLRITEVKPWGWDLALRSFLLRYGVSACPSETEIAQIRELSHRRHAMQLLHQLQLPGTIGHSELCDTIAGVQTFLQEHQSIVVKAPWSSSGRGIRFIDGVLSDSLERWIGNVIDKQGSVMLEPYYHKVKDFGMEFESDGQGHVRYLGLSLFHTRNGAYTGNVIATEEDKEDMLSRFVKADKLSLVRNRLCEALDETFGHSYAGPLGVDMMVVASPPVSVAPAGDHFLLHPCVEVNLRRTMGHVALAVKPFLDGFPRVMQIQLTDRYRIQIRKQR
jgi:hypothetical protein